MSRAASPPSSDEDKEAPQARAPQTALLNVEELKAQVAAQATDQEAANGAATAAEAPATGADASASMSESGAAEEGQNGMSGDESSLSLELQQVRRCSVLLPALFGTPRAHKR